MKKLDATQLTGGLLASPAAYIVNCDRTRHFYLITNQPGSFYANFEFSVCTRDVLKETVEVLFTRNTIHKNFARVTQVSTERLLCSVVSCSRGPNLLGRVN